MSVTNLYELEETPSKRLHVLPTALSAIPVLPSDDNGLAKLGLITQLPEGAAIEIRGVGFNDVTLRVRCGAATYFVFRDDLDLALNRFENSYA